MDCDLGWIHCVNEHLPRHKWVAHDEEHLAALRAECDEWRGTEAVLRGEIRRAESALATFDDVVADRDVLREQMAQVEALQHTARRHDYRLCVLLDDLDAALHPQGVDQERTSG